MSGRYVTRFVLRRLAAAVVLLIAISLGTFALLALAPGDPVQLLLAGRPRTPEIIQGLRETYHLDGSFFARYTSWAGSALHLDFGESVNSRQDVIEVIRHKAPLTLQLAGVSFVLTLLLGIPLGVAAALRRGGALDRTIVGSTVVGVSLPPFVTGIMLIYLFAVTLGWLPSFGEGAGAGGRAQHLILPAVALTATALAIVVKMTRTAMVRELDQDYVVFARARGVSTPQVVFRYALRNALIPVVTAGGLILGYMVGGAVLVEQVFSLPGLGSLLVEAARARDLPMLQGVVLVIALAVVLINLLTDLLYLAIDPRIRFGQESA